MSPNIPSVHHIKNWCTTKKRPVWSLGPRPLPCKANSISAVHLNNFVSLFILYFSVISIIFVFYSIEIKKKKKREKANSTEYTFFHLLLAKVPFAFLFHLPPNTEHVCYCRMNTLNTVESAPIARMCTCGSLWFAGFEHLHHNFCGKQEQPIEINRNQSKCCNFSSPRKRWSIGKDINFLFLDCSWKWKSVVQVTKPGYVYHIQYTYSNSSNSSGWTNLQHSGGKYQMREIEQVLVHPLDHESSKCRM